MGFFFCKPLGKKNSGFIKLLPSIWGNPHEDARICMKLSNFIYSPTDAPVSCLKKNNIKMYMKIYIKTAPTYFGITITS